MRFRDYPDYLRSEEKDRIEYVRGRTAKEAVLTFLEEESRGESWHKVDFSKVTPLVGPTRDTYRLEYDEWDGYHMLPSDKGVIYYEITDEAVEAMRQSGVRFWMDEE